MHHAGLLAHSPDGAALCFTTFCHEGQKRFGKPIHPDITLDYIAMGHALPAWEKGDLATVRGILAKSIDRLARAGADFFFCADNTAHIALEMPGPRLALPGLHIADIVAEEARERVLSKIGILGTRFTMNGPVYQKALERVGLSALVPHKDQQMSVDRIIFEELVVGKITDHSKDQYYEIILDFKNRGCDGVVMACTEIPLLICEIDSALPLLDSTRLLARRAFDVAVDQSGLPDWFGGPA